MFIANITKGLETQLLQLSTINDRLQFTEECRVAHTNKNLSLKTKTEIKT